MLERDPGAVMQELLARAVQGDNAALGKLLDAHRGYLGRIAQRNLDGMNARMGVSDLIQQTCLSAYRDFPKFKGQQIGEFIAWLGRIHEQNVNDAFRKHVQAKGRAVNREQPMPAGERANVASGEWSPSEQAMAKEWADALSRQMEELPEDQRAAVSLRYHERLPLAEIADRLGRSETAVAGLLKRGLEKLRQHLNDEERGRHDET